MKKVKNSWSEGLIMDFAPENTSPNSLTSALNATILTYNGNEMTLQNDMGNARIETAFLPEGYVPVGTCEYGDIIYIVSYNPLTNKSQIGCFPSPERNISSDEIFNDLGILLSNKDFLETTDITIINEQNGETETRTVPTGKLISSSVKKIVYNKNLQPGDKYFIYQKDGNEESFKNFSDYDGNGLNSFPKYLKAHVVSILDDGKIELLDSSVKWYDKYFIPTIQQESGKYDIDSYRDALSSGYSIFSSKISGKLALLVELEKITGFNCTYNVYPNEDKYKVYWNISWSTNNNDINPKYIVLTKSDSSNENIPKAYPDEGYYYKEITSVLKDAASYTLYQYFSYDNQITLRKYEQLYPTLPGEVPVYKKRIVDYKTAIPVRENNFPSEKLYYLDAVTTSIIEGEIIYKNAKGTVLKPEYVNDDIINNYFKSSIYKEFADFDKGDYIYNYEITPAMPYGLLEEYAIQGSIDFSKVGTDFILLHTWKYYNTEDYATLTLGLDAYVSENKAIAGIDLKFYDAHGLSAIYTINNKESYSGTFTEYIPLNGINDSLKLINRDNGFLILHKGNSLKDLGITKLLEGYLYESEGNLYEIKQEKDIFCIKKDNTTEFINSPYYKINIDKNLLTYNDLDQCYILDIAPVVSLKEGYYYKHNNNLYYIREAFGNYYVDIPNQEQNSNDLGNSVVDSLKITSIENVYTISRGSANLKNLYFKYNNNYYKIYYDINFDDIYENIYINDSGILYSNILYGVEIIIKYYSLDSLGNLDLTDESYFKKEYRWMWTNQMLNSQYKFLKDFKDAVGDLTLDIDAYYKTNDRWFKDQYLIENEIQLTNNSKELYKNLSANVQEISGGENIDSSIIIKLKDTYNTFKLNAGTQDNPILKNNTLLLILEGKSHIEDIQGTVIQTNESKFDVFNGIYPINAEFTNYVGTISINNPVFGNEVENSSELYFYNINNEINSSSTAPSNTPYSIYSKLIPITIQGDLNNLDKIVITLTSDYYLRFYETSKSSTISPLSIINTDNFIERIPITNNNLIVLPGEGGSSSTPSSGSTISGGAVNNGSNLSDITIGFIGCNPVPGRYEYELEFSGDEIEETLIYLRVPHKLCIKNTETGLLEFKELNYNVEIKNTKFFTKTNLISEIAYKLSDGSYIYTDPKILQIKYVENNLNITAIRNNSKEILKNGDIQIPEDNLNTEQWEQYKNQYYLKIKDSIEQKDIDINYITCTNLEVNLKNPYGVNLTSQLHKYIDEDPITVNYSFRNIHYSKFYKEVYANTKQTQVLVPLLNTVLDLFKYNLRMGDDNNLYFSLFVGMGVGYGDHSHRVITLYLSNDDTVGEKTKYHYVSDGGANHIGITKYSSSHQYWSLWQTQLSFDTGETAYLKDLVFGIVPVLFGNQNSTDSTRVLIVEDNNYSAIITPSSTAIKIPDSHTISTITSYGYTFNSNNNKIGLCSFLMKDVNGDLHAINNLFPLEVDNNKIQQKSTNNYYIGNAIASILSNMYVVSNLFADISLNYIYNIVHLRNQKSKFYKDLVYKFSINLRVNHKSLILICGVSLTDYINKVKEKLTNLKEEEVLIGINDIIKNIPMQFEFDYIEPDKSILNDEAKKVYIRKSFHDYYSLEPINYNLEQDSIYFINSDNIIEKLHSYILFKNIHSVTQKDSTIIYTYDDSYITHSDMDIFTYKDNLLTLVKTNYPSSQLYAIKIEGRWEGISGIVKSEYLTTIGKYV